VVVKQKHITVNNTLAKKIILLFKKIHVRQRGNCKAVKNEDV